MIKKEKDSNIFTKLHAKYFQQFIQKENNKLKDLEEKVNNIKIIFM